MREKKYYIYILTNKTNHVLYTGVTSDLIKRIYEHKNNLCKGFTKQYKVHKLVYYEAFLTAYDAISREKQIKAGSRQKKLDLIIKFNPKWHDLYDVITSVASARDCHVAIAPRNDNGVASVPRNGNGIVIAPCNDNGVASASRNDNGVASMPCNDNGIVSVPCKDNGVASVPRNDNGVASVPRNDNGVASVPRNDNGVASAPRKDNGIVIAPCNGALNVNAASARDCHVAIAPRNDNGIVIAPCNDNGIVIAPCNDNGVASAPCKDNGIADAPRDKAVLANSFAKTARHCEERSDVAILIHVAVGIILNSNNQVLMALRHAHLHQGGKWEFPGGKIEQAETINEALQRELYEEVGIHVLVAQPFMQVRHNYPEKSVLLDVYLVTQFSGEPHGKEEQEIRWVNITKLNSLDMPQANKIIVEALLERKNEFNS